MQDTICMKGGVLLCAFVLYLEQLLAQKEEEEGTGAMKSFSKAAETAYKESLDFTKEEMIRKIKEEYEKFQNPSTEGKGEGEVPGAEGQEAGELGAPAGAENPEVPEVPEQPPAELGAEPMD
jgi:hypothetical protein